MITYKHISKVYVTFLNTATEQPFQKAVLVEIQNVLILN